MKLTNKISLITGAGSGFGRACAILFAKEGAKISVVDMDEKTGQETVALLKQKGGQAIFIRADVSKTSEVEKMVNNTMETYGKIDILFNNAGIPMSFTPVETITEELWNKIQDVNVKGIFLGSKYAIPYMKKQGGGVILNTASISGVRPPPVYAPTVYPRRRPSC